MGSSHLNEQGQIRARGTEIGAFVRLDDLDKERLPRHGPFDFLQSGKRQCPRRHPASPYDTIITDQKVDLFLYANNYTDKRGLRAFDSKEEAVQTFIEGKRFALGTTQEKGLSTTFFANPFGPMQKQAECLKIIDQMFAALLDQKIFLGEIYTGLGLPERAAMLWRSRRRRRLRKSARNNQSVIVQ